MKKVLFIHFWSTLGGSSISLYNTWKSLNSKYDIVTYIPERPSDLYEFLKSKNLNAKTYSFTSGQIPYYNGGRSILDPVFWYFIISSIHQISFWKKIIEKENPDIIMVNSKVLCWLAPLFKGRISVCFVRETIKGDRSNFINRIINLFLEQFSIVSFLSEFDLHQANLKKAVSIVSPDILFPEDYEDTLGKTKACELLKIDSKSFNIAFVGGSSKIKGLDIAIESLKSLKNENIKLIIAGDDFINNTNTRNQKFNILKCISMLKELNYSKKVRNIINKNNLENMIAFVGVQKQMSIIYSASDILVFPMTIPHQSRPAFEVGIQSKPVIISDYINVHEFVKNGINGILFEPKNSVQLSNAIMKLKENRILLKEMGKSNYKYSIMYHSENFAMGVLENAINNELDNL